MKKLLILLMTCFILTGCNDKNFEAPLDTIMDNLYEGIDTEGLRKTSVVRHSELEIETLDNVEYTDILISVPYNREDGNSIILLRSDNPKDTINQISYRVDDNAVIKNEGNLIMVVNYYDQTTQNKIIENFDKLFD
jgi:hypothetical protein